jgi:arginyl-tRNA synthetase
MICTSRLHFLYRNLAACNLKPSPRATRKCLRRIHSNNRASFYEDGNIAIDDTLFRSVRRLVEFSVQNTFPQYVNVVDVTECTNPVLGDYQSSSAMQIYSAMKRQGESTFKSPRDVAEAIVAGISNSGIFESIAVAGPGFINLRVSREFISASLLRLNRTQKEKKNRHVLVDFSSPNIAKEMHVGHLRSTIIGDAICNIFEYCGYSVTRVNHVGDWGTQFGMLIEYLKDNDISAQASVSDLQSYYKKAKQRFDSDELFKKRAQEEVVKLQAYDAKTIEVWEKICQISRDEFQTIYDRLGIKIIERGESFYNNMIPGVLEELETGGFIVEDSGALCIFNEQNDTPVICRKSDGAFNYASTDLAALHYRITHEKADEIIYVTDLGQHKHFDAIFRTAIDAGWCGVRQVQLKHVGFGVVLGEDGKRLRTRSGDTIKLKALLDEAESRCETFLLGKGTSLSSEDVKHASKILGMNSVKYADLHNNRTTNYTFSFDRMLDLKGNTAMYLQYSHARVATVLERAGPHVTNNKGQGRNIQLSNDAERLLALQLLKFEDAIATSAQELMPSRLCEYLYSLCTTFNNFYAECKVLGSENEQTRVYLCEQTKATMHLAFSLLGMVTLERI